jgi:[ribosomal protein S5]-alanine N-acetyltransferase
VVPEFETSRLILRPLELNDAEPLQRLFPRWEVVRFLAAVVPWPYPEDGAATYLRERALPAMERGDEWHWSIRLKTAPAEMIGAIGLMRGEEDNRGFWMVPEFQGRGLMTEAADRVMEFWFDDLGMARMRIPKAIENIGSRRISEKQGMRIIRTEEREYVCGRKLAEVWELTAEEWRCQR